MKADHLVIILGGGIVTQTRTFTRGLGRIAQFDARSRNYPLSAVIPRGSAPTYKYWHLPRKLPLNQGATSRCVVFSEQTLLIAGPTVNPVIHDPTPWYNWAQQNDAWPGEDYEGTSILAGLKYGIMQGWFSEYRWAFTLQECIDWVLTGGPLLVGTNWYEDMFTPASSGFIYPSGSLVAGHAYTLVGCNAIERKFKVMNVWGPSWGRRGTAWITFDSMEALLNMQGEAVAVTEV